VLAWRLAVSAVVIALLLGLLYLDHCHPWGAPGAWLLPLAALVAVLASGELLAMWHAQHADQVPVSWLVQAGCALVVVSAATPVLWQIRHVAYPAFCPLGRLGWSLAAFYAALSALIVSEMVRYTQPGKALPRLAIGTVTLAYVGVSLSFLVQLRLFGTSAWGMTALISLLAVVKGADTGAYCVGRLIGRHRLAPRLSPGKTVEGLAGGLASGVAAAMLCRWLLVPSLVGPNVDAGSRSGWIVYGVLLSVCGLVGDLAESLLKRDLQRKDSSRWLPGLGGILDMLDSLLLAAPAAYACWLAGLVGPGAG
jgi:phosphatidate cytidylyltransferase